MSSSNSNKHLTLQERSIIETGIRNRSSKKAIADTLGKDKSTIGKEILSHRQLTKKCNLPLECADYKKCKHGRNCKSSCPDFVPFSYKFRDRSPGACNGCPTLRAVILTITCISQTLHRKSIKRLFPIHVKVSTFLKMI